MISQQKKWVEAGSIILVCSVFMWWNPASLLSPVRGALWLATKPVADFFGYVHREVSDIVYSFARIASLKSDNALLVEEAAMLRGKIAALEDVQKENDRLREEISSSLRRTDRVVSALIVGYDAQGAGDWLLVDKGDRDGVIVGMTAVFGDNILVGTVENVEYSVSRIRLMNNPKSVFAAHTVESNAKGVVRGKFGLGILFDSVLQTDALSEGDRVVTSELGETYPPGLFVGMVKSVGHSSDGLFQQAVLSFPVDFFGIKAVSIIR